MKALLALCLALTACAPLGGSLQTFGNSLQRQAAARAARECTGSVECQVGRECRQGICVDPNR